MNFSVESTMAVKSVKSGELHEISDFIFANTKGLMQMQDASDTIPEFPHAKILYANYVSPQHARKAVELTMVECARRGWGGGLTRATTKDKLSSIKRSEANLSQLFPVFVGGLPTGNKQQQQLELRQLYSKYGSCWTDVASANCYAFIHFDDFDSARAALNDSNGVKYKDLILRANKAFDTVWTCYVWTELETAGKLSFATLQKTANYGVRSPSGKPFYPKNYLAPLRCVPQFRVSDAEQQVTWSKSEGDLQPARSSLHATAVPNDPCATWASEASRALSDSSRSPSQCSEVGLPGQSDADRSEAGSGGGFGSGDEASEAGSSSSAQWRTGQHLNDIRQPAVQSGREHTDARFKGLEQTECGTPSKYVCPIGQDLMADPVRLSNGQVYDRPTIEQYLAQGKHVCPLTQVRIDPCCVTPVPALKAEIASYKQSQRSVDVGGSASKASRGPSCLDSRPLAGADPARMQREGTGETLALTAFNGSGSCTFKLVAHLGGGGMGDVYRAERISEAGARAAGGGAVTETLALKICFPLRDGRRERNEREAENLRRLQEIKHENVIRMVGSGSSPTGRVVLVMEEITSHVTLNDMMDHWPTPRVQAALAPFGSANDGNLRPSLDLCMEVLGQMLCGMAAVHTQGIAHRDLKPSNVMLQPLGSKLRVVIIDFGLSKDTGSDHTVTGTGQSLGTASYMSPEQIDGTTTHEMAVDVWALGVMAYTMLQGRHPFAHGTSVPPRTEAEKSALILNIRSMPMLPLPEHSSTPLLTRFLSVALDKDADRRFRSANPMEQAFLDLKLSSDPRFGQDKAEAMGLQGGVRREKMEQAVLDLRVGSESTSANRKEEMAGVDPRAASSIKSDPPSDAESDAPTVLSRKAVRLSDATVAEVSALLQRLGGKFGSAAEVVEENEVGGEDLQEFLEDEGTERNPLYMPVEEGGLGLGEIQVRKLRRELAKLFPHH